jgi:hypothetical protein
MRDVIVTVVTSRAFRQLQQMQGLNEVLDNENISEYSSEDDSVFDHDSTQLMTPGTHVISDSESDNVVKNDRKKT